MKLSHIELLQCIECGGTLEFDDGHASHICDNFIARGILRCQGCNESFPIIDGVGIFFKKSLLSYFLNDYEKRICDSLKFTIKKTTDDLLDESLLAKQVADNWSYQWNTLAAWEKNDFEKDDFNGALNFRKFIRIEPEKYMGKKIVVWCGGNGREAYHISKNNPQLLIVIEIGDEIYRINGLIDRNINLLLIRCDMLCNPLRSGIVDISICDHALQHVIDKRGAFSTLANVLSQDGTAAACVYSYENNFIMTHIIEPLKGIIHKMTLNGQKFISLFPAIFIFLLIKFFYLPANYLFPVGICRKIPLFNHMMFWSKGNFRLIWISCFDLIHAPISYHFSKNEVQKLAQQAGLHIDKLINTHGTTWSMTAKKTIMPSAAVKTLENPQEFYDGAWEQWKNMIKYSPAPRMRRNKIISWLSSVSPKNILDVGCGNGEFLMDVRRLMPDVKLTGADISTAITESNRIKYPNIEFLKIDLNKEASPVKFDAVICMEVIEHCDDYRAAVKRLAAMTGKWLLITVPCGPVFEIDRRVGHKRHFKPKEMAEALKNEGLHVIKLEDWGFPFFNLYKHMINLRPDKMCELFLSEQEYSFRQKMLASATYAAFNLCLSKWGYQLFVMASR